MSDDETREIPEDEDEGEEDRPRRSRLRGVARRLLDDPGPVRETKEVLGAILDSSDKAKTEMIRMVGREVRAWLDGLGVAEGLHYLLTNYSLEVSASVHLKPLADKIPPPPHERRAAKPADGGE